MRLCILLLALSISFAAFADAPAPRVVDIKSADGTLLKATFYPAAKPGPGVLLLHQGNRTRQSWDELAKQLAAAGINTLSYDMRLHGESGGMPLDKMTPEQRKGLTDRTKDDADAGLRYLASQPGVRKDDIGIGMAGWPGVVNGVEAARRHPEQVKSLVLMSGETVRDGLQYLHETQMPELFVVSDRDEYPPTREAMELLYDTASSPGKRLLRYSASGDAPWLWYETAFSDQDKVASTGDHGTDLFKPHPELPGMIVDWFVTTLITTPGHAPVDALAAAPLLNKLEWGGSAGIAEVTQQLEAARKQDPEVQLFPEADVDIIGEDYDRAGDSKSAIQVFKLNLLAYPDSIDAHSNLMDAYMQDGQKGLARPLAEQVLKLLDEGKMPLSSWADTPVRRAESRKDVEDVLQQLKQGTAAAFRDCPDCPEMVTIPAGSFTMGSSDAEKRWVVAHGGTLDSVADEAPQHPVALHAFAIGEYDVTRAEYAAFVKDTGHASVKGCYQQGNPDSPFYPDATWQAPGFSQTDQDPVVCVDWHDAQAYVAWLNTKSKGGGGYRLPTEAEWEYAARGGAPGKFWWGEDEDETAAPDHAWFKDDAGGATHPVGQKPANGFGLYDAAGDVWQWTEDCYVESYAKAPVDGSAVLGAPACRRSDRGGSWFYPAWLLRAATRERNPPDYKDGVLGFRVAKTLP
jgi:formylglycine-generating enzyme required for sulfatase activity/dienelactone hydrolase